MVLRQVKSLKKIVLIFLQEINLEYNQNSISFDFEVPTYHGSKVHTYQWQLQGYDKVPKSSKKSEKTLAIQN